MSSSPPICHQISKCTVKPSPLPGPTALKLCPLTPWDLARLSTRYIQKGLLYSDLPSSLTTEIIVQRLKSSLSTALSHFYPIAGRFITEEKPLDESNGTTGMCISIDCSNEGAEFVQAAARDITVADVLAAGEDVPVFVRAFFPLNGAVNYDGHDLPLVAVQLTELSDGIFIACCFSHAAGDGNSYWNFFNAWAEVSRSGDFTISRPPVLDRWFVEGTTNPPIKLPFSSVDEFIERYNPPTLRERIFHFSSHCIAKLKARANKECDNNTISSFQALCSLIWRCIVRARRTPDHQKVTCVFSIQNRTRLQPPLSPDYFGNSIDTLSMSALAGELLAERLGWAALEMQKAGRGHNNEAIRGSLREYPEKPRVSHYGAFDKNGVLISSSPRFDVYGCDFGWGKAVAMRSGAANKLDGKVMAYPGREGGGSVELEVCLVLETMDALLLDEEFMSVISPLQ